MTMLFSLVPAALPDGYGEALVPLADARLYLRVDGTDEDDLIGVLRDAAIDLVEKYTNTRLRPVPGMVARFDGFGDAMRLGWGPSATVAVTDIDYVDSDGAAQALADGAWRLGADGRLLPALDTCWPATRGLVNVTFTAGYPADTCPAALLGAVRMMLVHLFDNRTALISDGLEADVPLGVVMACSRYRERPGL